MEVFTVRAAVARATVRRLEALGISPALLAQDTGVDLACLEDPDARIPEITVLSLWLAAEARWPQELLGLHAGKETPPDTFDVLDYLATSAPTLGGAFTRLAEYSAIANTGLRYVIEDDPAADNVVVSMTHPYALDLLPASFIEYLWALIVTRTRDKLLPTVSPTLTFRHQPLGPLAMYREVLGHVVFGATREELRVPRDLWLLDNPRQDPALSTLLERHTRALIAELPKQEGPLDQVKSAITAALKTGDVGVERAASRLGVTPRTLQRQLAAAGTSYAELLDSVREGMARIYLSARTLSLGEISYLLGYSEPSAFNRAFRRWAGETPLDFRRRVLGSR